LSVRYQVWKSVATFLVALARSASVGSAVLSSLLGVPPNYQIKYYFEHAFHETSATPKLRSIDILSKVLIKRANILLLCERGKLKDRGNMEKRKQSATIYTQKRFLLIDELHTVLKLSRKFFFHLGAAVRVGRTSLGACRLRVEGTISMGRCR
jgi:hypothetical protein